MKSVTAFAPASVGNAAVGFDVLGFSFDVVGDRVHAEISDRPGVEISEIVGPGKFPLEAEKNTAGVALLALIQKTGIKHGFKIRIEKGIPLGSGMGGSAASAVAAVVAGNALLKVPLPKAELLAPALAGESVASGSSHADNVAPCLWGGLTLVLGHEVVPVPTPPGVFCVLVHPHLVVETRAARDLLKPSVSLADHVRQSELLAGFLAGCFKGDISLLRKSLSDILIEPQRAVLISGFAETKAAALAAGAIGFSISGSGPSVFAWAEGEREALAVKRAIEGAFTQAQLGFDSWVAPLAVPGANGARVIPP